jgi:hypothetical protein
MVLPVADAPYSMRLSQEKSGKRFYQFKSISKSFFDFLQYYDIDIPMDTHC